VSLFFSEDLDSGSYMLVAMTINIVIIIIIITVKRTIMILMIIPMIMMTVASTNLFQAIIAFLRGFQTHDIQFDSYIPMIWALNRQIETQAH